MNDEIELVLDDAKDRMEKALQHLESELSKIRAGKASPAMLKDLKVEYYGCLLYTSPSPRDRTRSRMPSSA